MTRIARIVVPHAPHHVTQRGNRRERVFQLGRAVTPAKRGRKPKATGP